jgi:heat shock protein HslJ
MKKYTLLLFLMACVTFSCNSAKKTAKQHASATSTQTNLTGTWELDLLPYPNGPLEKLYPRNKPSLTFNGTDATYNVYTGCNTGRGKVEKDGSNISFKDDIIMTKMACQGDGERAFLENLKKVNKFGLSPDEKTLTLIQGDIALMRFHKLTQ